MYETPKLNYVGQAHEVVLGFNANGFDFDSTSITPDMEFFEDSEPQAD